MSTWPILVGLILLVAAIQTALLTRALDVGTWAAFVAFAALYVLVGIAFVVERRGPPDR